MNLQTKMLSFITHLRTFHVIIRTYKLDLCLGPPPPPALKAPFDEEELLDDVIPPPSPPVLPAIGAELRVVRASIVGSTHAETFWNNHVFAGKKIVAILKNLVEVLSGTKYTV